MLLMKSLSTLYPSQTTAVTGWIPMGLFELIESKLRKEFKGEYRIIYRGPRKSNNTPSWQTPSMTRRCDATHAVIYKI